MSSAPVVSITDDLLAEIERMAETSASASGGEDWVGEHDLFGALANQCDIDFIVKLSPLTVSALTTELRRLRAEVGALRVDAARYRWLRDDSVNAIGTYPMVSITDDFGDQVSNWLFGGAVDKAIDTAMQSNTEGN